MAVAQALTLYVPLLIKHDERLVSTYLELSMRECARINRDNKGTRRDYQDQ